MKQTKLYWIEEQNNKWKDMGQLQRICPCCFNVVICDLFNKRSLFDINIVVCNACANSERGFHKIGFNWIIENQMKTIKLYRDEVINI